LIGYIDMEIIIDLSLQNIIKYKFGLLTRENE